jgi:outer membrane protein OmpA-like peptidoglycan-associated protein
MRVEGNCDEQGSSTYNLVLGQRRADFVTARSLYSPLIQDKSQP